MIRGDATLFLEHADIKKTQSILGTSEMDIVVILTYKSVKSKNVQN